MQKENNSNENQKTCNRNFCSCGHKGGSGCSHAECKCRQQKDLDTPKNRSSTTK